VIVKLFLSFWSNLLHISPLQSQKTKLLLLANDSKNQTKTNQKTKKIVSHSSLFSEKIESKVFMNQWIASKFYQPKVNSPENIIKKLHSLTLSKNTRPKKFTNRLAISEGLYNIHTYFQTLHLMQIFAHTLNENRAVEKKNEPNTIFCALLNYTFWLKCLLNVKINHQKHTNCQFFGEKKKHQLSFFGGVIRFTLHT